jgi:hypothetical protein
MGHVRCSSLEIYMHIQKPWQCLVFACTALLAVFVLYGATYTAIATAASPADEQLRALEGLEIENRQAIYAAAQQGIKVLNMIARGDNFGQEPVFRAYGFDSPGQASQLDLARPMQVMLVPDTKLLNYKFGSEPNSLLTPLHEIVFPVIGQGAVRTSMSVTFSRTQEKWKATGWGKPNLIRRLVELKQYRTSQTIFLVRFAALNLHFLGDINHRQLFLTPIFDDPRYGLIAGESLDTEKALLLLQAKQLENTKDMLNP